MFVTWQLGRNFSLLSYRHVEYRTPLKKVKCGRVRRCRSTPPDTPFTELGVLLWKQLESRAYVSVCHGQDIDKSRWWCQNILCFFFLLSPVSTPILPSRAFPTSVTLHSFSCRHFTSDVSVLLCSLCWACVIGTSRRLSVCLSVF
jgi:hypothetical protein